MLWTVSYRKMKTWFDLALRDTTDTSWHYTCDALLSINHDRPPSRPTARPRSVFTTVPTQASRTDSSTSVAVGWLNAIESINNKAVAIAGLVAEKQIDVLAIKDKNL